MRRALGAAGLVVLAAASAACSSAQAADRPVVPAPAAPDLPVAETLATAASDRAATLCEQGADGLEPDPGAYRQETWAELTELVGRAPLPDDEDEGAATEAAWAEVRAGWRGDLAGAPPTAWDRAATAEVACPDGHLYAVQVLARTPEPADAGAYWGIRLPAADIVHRVGVRYGRATDVTGRQVDLLLDLFLPDDAIAGATDRPLVVLVHGGGFTSGSRTRHTEDALGYARRGMVVATIDYRIDPDAGDSVAAHRAASFAAMDDGMEAVRWLRAHADELGADPDRIAVLGASAGGEIALATALLEDATPDGPLGGVSPRATAAFSTGAYLTPILGAARLDATDSPVLLQHFESDTASGRPWTYAAATCDAVRAAGATCDLAISEGTDHVVGIGPTSVERDRILAFLAVHLRLDD